MSGVGRRAGLVLATCALLGTSIVAGVAQSSGAKPAEPVWTDRPVKVDRGTQGYERVEPVAGSSRGTAPKKQDYPIRFRAQTFFKILDSVSFAQGGKTYRLAGLVPIPPAHVCKTANGERWACGARGRAALSTQLTTRALSCAERGKEADFVLLECQRSNQDVGIALVRAGFAKGADGAGRYAEELAKATAEKAGIWGDVSGLQ